MKYLKKFNESKVEDLEDYFQEMFDEYKIPKYSKEMTPELEMHYDATEDGIVITNIFSHDKLLEIMGYINSKKEQIEKRLGQKFIHNQHRLKYFNNPETFDKVGYFYEIEIYLD